MCFGQIGFEKSGKITFPVYQRSKKRQKQATVFHRATAFNSSVKLYIKHINEYTPVPYFHSRKVDTGLRMSYKEHFIPDLCLNSKNLHVIMLKVTIFNMIILDSMAYFMQASMVFLLLVFFLYRPLY